MLNKPIRCRDRNRKAAADLSSEVIGDFCVPANRFDPARLRLIQSECAPPSRLR